MVAVLRRTEARGSSIGESGHQIVKASKPSPNNHSTPDTTEFGYKPTRVDFRQALVSVPVS